MYFTLKDDDSTISAVMFKWQNRALRFEPKNGTKVVVKGSIKAYAKTGTYQVLISSMQPDGVGDLHLAFEELKRKLEAEGLFDPVRKRKIPLLPKTIAVVTSPTGAAVHDIITTIRRRYPIAKIIFLPVLVQGEGAATSVASAIELANQHGQADLLIVGRGGGSIEDLWAFNEELVARAIFSSLIPIISAVGHETDFTIADFVADLRAPTPTGAAEIATQITLNELHSRVADLNLQLKKGLVRKFERNQERLDRLSKSLERRHPKRLLQDAHQELDQLMDRFRLSAKHVLREKQNKLDFLIGKMDALSPLKTMSRGFSVAYKEGHVVKSIKEIAASDQVQLRLSDGKLLCTVNEVEAEL